MARPTRRLLTAVALIGVTAAFACAATASDSAKKGAATAPAADPASTVAQIGDHSITLKELDTQAAGQLAKVRQEEYDVRRQEFRTLTGLSPLIAGRRSRGSSTTSF